MSFLEINSVTKRFGGLNAVDALSLTIAKGSLTAIIGPNGCGKSTLFNLICEALKPDLGSISLEGQILTDLTPTEIAQRGVGRKFQIPSVFPDLSVLDNLRLPTLAPSYTGKNKNSLWSTEDILNLSRLSPGKLASELAHGEKQWLEIGMILAQSPSLILLDEPTAGMTGAETKQTAELIKTIIAKENTTVLVIEHDIGFIEQLDCHLNVMSSGKLLKSGSFLDIRNDKEVQELYFGRTRNRNA